jgi:hypothetical protein
MAPNTPESTPAPAESVALSFFVLPLFWMFGEVREISMNSKTTPPKIENGNKTTERNDIFATGEGFSGKDGWKIWKKSG